MNIFRVGNDVTVLNDNMEVPGLGFLPINAFGFLSLSIVKWQRSAPEHLYAFFAAGAILYLAGALLRASLRPPSTFGENSATLARIAGGSYEGPITLSAALAAGAILLRATGEWINLGLLIEGEILFLVGLRFGQRYLRQLAGAAFAGSRSGKCLPWRRSRPRFRRSPARNTRT